MTIQPGDFKALAKFLESHGINKEDISGLEKAVKSDPNPKSADAFGEKVSSWVGKMFEKASSGIWQVGIAAAGNILATAINAYYGFSK